MCPCSSPKFTLGTFSKLKLLIHLRDVSILKLLVHLGNVFKAQAPSPRWERFHAQAPSPLWGVSMFKCSSSKSPPPRVWTQIRLLLQSDQGPVCLPPPPPPPESVDPNQTAPAVCSLIRVLFACMQKKRFEKSARIFSRRHKQTTFSDAVFLGALRVNLSTLLRPWKWHDWCT